MDRWTVLKLCHQFVHSYVFHVVIGEPGGLAGLMVASDRQKESSLIELDIGSTISLFDSVAQDEVVSSQWYRDPVAGKETFVLSNKLPPETEAKLPMIKPEE